MDIRQRFSRSSVVFSSLSAPAFFWQPLQSPWSSLAANHMFGELNEDISLLNFPHAFIDHVDDDFSKGHQSIVHKKGGMIMLNVEGRGEKGEMLSGGWSDFGENKHRHHTELGMSGMREESVTSEPFLKLKVSDPSPRFDMAREDVSFLK